MILERLIVKIDGDLTGLEKAFTKADRKVRNAGKSMTAVGRDISTKVTLPILALGAASAKLAADAAEADSKFNVVFGRNAARVRQEIEGLGASIPAARQELIGLSAGIQDLLKPLGIAPDAAADMSVATLKLAGDLASFNNVRIDEVLLAIRSGMVGQSEPLLRFGADVRVAAVKAKALELGLMDLGGELTNAARAQAVLAIAAESNADAIGDAARTAGSASNQFKFFVAALKDLGEVLGNVILPALVPLVTGLTNTLKAAQALPEPVLKVGVALAALTAALGPLLILFGTMVTLLPAIKVGVTGIAAGAAAAAPVILAVAAGAAVIAGGFALWKRQQEGIADELARIRREAEGLPDSFTRFGAATSAADDMRIALEEARAKMEEIRNAPPIPPPLPPTSIASLEITNENLELLEQRADSLSDAIANARIDLQFEQDAEAARELADELSAVVDELERVNGAIARQRLGGAGVGSTSLGRRSRSGGVDIDGDRLARTVEATSISLKGLQLQSKKTSESFIDFGSIKDSLGSMLDPTQILSGAAGNLLSGALSGGVSFAINGLISGLGSLFGPSNEDRIRDNTNAIRENTAAINAGLRGKSGGLVGAATEALQAQLASGAFSGMAFLATFSENARLAGTSIQEIGALFNDLGLTLVGTREGFEQALEVLTGPLFETLEGRLGLARRKGELLDLSTGEQFSELQSALAQSLPGGLSDLNGLGVTIARLDPDSIDQFVAGIFSQIEAGTFDLSRLGGVSLDEFLDAIGQLESLADAAGEASDALSETSSILNAPSGFKVALERYRATEVGIPSAEIRTGSAVNFDGGGVTFGKGAVTIVVEDGDPNTGRRIVDALKREIEFEQARGGGDQLNLDAGLL